MSFLPFEALSAIPGDVPMTHNYKSYVDVRDEKWRSILVEMQSVMTLNPLFTISAVQSLNGEETM